MNSRTLPYFIVLSTMFFLFPQITAFAQAGALDLTFDIDGKVTTALNGNIAGIAIQTDGKIVAAGISNFPGSNIDFAVARYTSNGVLDSSFSNDGITTVAFGVAGDACNAVAIQADGKIVLAGYSFDGSKNNFAVARLNPNGSLDSTFDGDGKLTTSIGTLEDIAYAMAIQPDGKILVGGQSNNGSGYDLALVRYNVNGTLDNGFDADGKVVTATSTSTESIKAIAVQPNNKILVAGNSWNGLDNDFMVVRYNTNGSLDTSFDNDGIVTTAINASEDDGNAIALQADGKILVAGSSWNGADNDFAVVRYLSNGALDNTFDTDGIVTTTIGTSEDIAYAIQLQSNGKIIAAGLSDNGTDNDFALVRYNTNGSLDNSFDVDGKVTTAIGTKSEVASAIALQSDGKIVAGGYSETANGNAFALVRYGNNIASGVDGAVVNHLSIFPNPAQHATNIQFAAPVAHGVLTIFNAEGQQVKQFECNNEQNYTLAVDDLPQGLYVVKICTGDKVVTHCKLLVGL